MKCQYCNKEAELKEVKSIKYTYCCGDIQVDPLSLRPKVQKSIEEEIQFFNELRDQIKKGSLIATRLMFLLDL